MADTLDLQTTYRAILEAARHRRFISYGDLAKANGAEWNKVWRVMNQHLGELVKLSAQRGWPMPSAVVVPQESLGSGILDGTARNGFIAAAKENGLDVGDPETFVKQQQETLFAWAATAPDDLGLPTQTTAKQPAGPQFVRYFGPVLEALRLLGGSAEPKAVMAKVRDIANVSEKELSETNKNGGSKYENKVGWAKFYLAKAGLVETRQRALWALTDQGQITVLDQAAALELFKSIHSRFRDVADDEDAPPPSTETPGADLFDDPQRRYWFVGASWDAGDQTERFLSEGVWQNGYDTKFADLVKRIKPGDRIAIKATFTKKYGLPFANHDKPVSCMRIKATGTVTSATTDGKTVKVDWTRLVEPKEWYFYTYRTTIVEADASDEWARRLIQFAFGSQKQDYDYYLQNPYWGQRYRGPAETTAAVELEEEEAITDRDDVTFAPYGLSDIVTDGCFLSDAELDTALARLKTKKNIILQGPPGTGKTWLAKRLGYALIGTKDAKVTRKRMRVIQFHPSLSYEDFVRGWRPNGDGKLSLVDGVFLEAVAAARAERDRPLVVVIEEINRGNPAQIFGEMLTFLEASKRSSEDEIELAYPREPGERVFIPDNLYVIGTMNIADRSLALVDLALRRRFAFMSLQPTLNKRWRDWCTQHAIAAASIDAIERAMTALNEEIAGDRSLGTQFKIGHSYVTPERGAIIENPQLWFRQIVETELRPLLEEYWFDNPGKAETMTKRLLEGL